jgi:hypothetical protein
MKMISNTNMMSTIGVTLISDWRPPPPPPAAIPITILPSDLPTRGEQNLKSRPPVV